MLLSRVALKLISEEHMKVYYETSIKSYFYDRAGERVKNLCGPLWRQFSHKFRGKNLTPSAFSCLNWPKRPFKCPLHSTNRPFSAQYPPKLKELEKLAKADRRKPQKANKYAYGVSDLEKKIAKKLANNLSTQQIVLKIVKNSSREFENRKIITQNYLRMTSINAEEPKFL